MAFHPDLRLLPLVDAALAGARAAMAVYRTDIAVDRKSDGSPVSVADQNSERAIVERLARAFPQHPIIAEEACSAGAAPRPGRAFLLVDPLDGTKEFISRNGEFTVNIALIEDGLPVLGVVLAPALGLAFAGGRDCALRGGVDPTSQRVEGWTRMAARAIRAPLIAVASRSHLTPATEEALRLAGVKERRSIGSSLKFCLLAAGEADFYPRLGPTMEWDVAAGDAVLRAAGGAVVTLDGELLRYGKTGIAGMRDFENPHFLAAGDPAFLKRFPFARLATTKAA